MPVTTSARFSGPVPTVDDRVALASVLTIVRQRTGADFDGYRPATIGRRVANRMISVGATSLGEYLALLERTPVEAQRLLERLTIKVSRFYRNPRVFDLLRTVVLAQLAATRGVPLRLWSAGCGCGEEAWTLAMLLDALDVPGTVLATDIDGSALTVARSGSYPVSSTTDLPAELAARYLQPDPAAPGERVRVVDTLHSRVRFLRYDLIAATPAVVPAFHLVACRNVLIYMQPAVQDGIVGRLAGALVEGGVLVLGEAEWITPALSPQLAIVDGPGRIFCARRASGIRVSAG